MKNQSYSNIFIGASEEENNREQVRNQHCNRFIEFLTNELKVCTKEEAENRFFFISAREMLESRLKAKGEIKNGSFLLFSHISLF
jgi:mitofusin